MAVVVALLFVGLQVAVAIEEASLVCGRNGQDGCPQQRRGQALLQTGGHQQLGVGNSPRRSTAYVQVGSSGISLPPQLALWTNGSAGLAQLQEKARTHAASAKQSPAADPVPIGQWISNTLIPQAQLTIQQLNNEIEAADEEVKQCRTNRQQAEEGISDDKTFLTGAESRRSECEVTSAEQHTAALAACQSLKDFYVGLSPPTPTLQSMVCETCNKTTEEIVAQLSVFNTFYKTTAPQFQNLKAVCEGASGQDAHIATECLEDRKGIEKSYCSLTKAQMDICGDYKACFNEKIAAFDKVEVDVKKLEEHVKSNFKAMSCFDLEGDSKCDPKTLDVGHLSVVYKDRPADVACTGDIGVAWNYSHVDCPELRVFEETAETATPESDSPVA